eukprot:CAMPEP_0185579262 /NCGR_PEP_ID=MMETSP0434-20130131/14103_1 /TAXON_ID=626734 ORGANISM="Favella taraikaensis, Strain Fe Narragansett Bay" /NCGR_SAMPLE_ID=MMETSP0434 /ASSEMBLY_ACC=CAM_ASM_000379 /LENGTH=179 /DNA_ID=CAMNT_0028197249 /DNA_START=229 /DNA_END=768 /DNA_ORIENTATION=+
MMLEETLIRENAQAKVSRSSTNKVGGGPPVATFAGLKTMEETKGGEPNVDSLNENNFDVVQSPMRRAGGTFHAGSDSKAGSSGKGKVPQEQYDALKARFIESETQFQRRIESINDLQKTIERREEQLVTLEKMYLGKLEDAKRELEQFKATARDSERSMSQELKTEKEERQKAESELHS